MDFLSAVFNAWVQLVAILNPVGAAPIYLSLVSELSPVERRRVALTVTATVVALIVVFAVAGDAVLRFYGATIDELRFAGGVILLYVAVRRIVGGGEQEHVRVARDRVLEEAITPLATPILMGPGTMTVTILLAAEYGSPPVVVAALLAGATVLATLLASELILKPLGPTAVKVSARITALIIAVVGASMLHGALRAWGIAAR